MSTKFTLADSWKDTYNNVLHKLYETKEGLRFIHVINKNTIEFDFSVVVKGGSFYEKQLNVPVGTAHFLEHVMCGESNKKFKTKSDLQKFTYGTRKKAAFSYGATTSKRCIYYNAHGNESAANRMIDFVFSEIDAPLDNTYIIEKERKIILAEYARRLKEERNSGLQFDKFLYGDIYPEFITDNLGTKESINIIKLSDLKKYFKNIFTIDNVVLAIQSNKELTPTQFKKLYKFKDILARKKNKLKPTSRKLKPEFRHHYFHNPDMKEVFFSISYLYDAVFGVLKDYKEDRLKTLLSDVLWKCLNEYLREEKHLIYKVGTFNKSITFNYMNRGISVECEKENLLEVLNGIDHVFKEYTLKFLESDKGEEWFESVLSHYIFKTNTEFDSEYAEDLGHDILYNWLSKYDFIKAKKAILKISIKDVYNYFRKFITIPPAIWIESSHDEKEIVEIFKKSKFYKRYKLSSK